ncbi:hypothetical protein D0Z00_003966 [Geotrichum galactomycetum]|uniref:Uncharacterized protein n=1 Tax=Geotrichum galactomycetum TaxID=27317 RepID=A0ACB6UZT4_9ASCO|nr:hypothetical protein D0Z00_003966 [Geotrichum candidum]
MLHFFDLADKARIEKMMERNKHEGSKDHRSLDARSVGSLESLHIDDHDHSMLQQQQPHHFRKTFSALRKGLNSITPTSTTSSGSHKKVTKKRSSHFSKKLLSFGSRNHSSDHGDSDSDSDVDFSTLSPVDSIASFIGAPSYPQQSLSSNSTHNNGSGIGKIQLFSAKSNSSGSNASTTSSNRGHHMHLLTSSSNSALSSTAAKNSRNAVLGTGTYTMTARKKPYFQNTRADHSTINQNQLTLPEFLTGLRKNSSAVRSVVENLLLVSEHDLPFIPDPVESVITLFDIMIGLYRIMLSDVENTSKYNTQSELNEIELLIASIEMIMRRTVISEALVRLDSEYIKRRADAQCRDVIEQDIIRACSQPNAITPTTRSSVPSIKVV